VRIDLEYISTILDVFLESDKAHIVLTDLQDAGINLDGEGDSFNELFMFHMQIVIDNQLIGLVTGAAQNLKDIGVNHYRSGKDMIINTPIRLTQNGHDFASVLNNKEVLSKLKNELKDAPFKVIFEGGQKLLQHLMTKKLDSLLK
jgi:hypothetical protein